MTQSSVDAQPDPTYAEFVRALQVVSPHIHHTPVFSSRILSERSGCDVRLKAELFQRGGSYKIRGPLYKLSLLAAEQRQRGVICSSAGNHAQGVALAAQLYGVRAVVVMATNATPSKIEATRAYGAEIVLHGTIWDEANERAQQIAAAEGLTYIHPFDDRELIIGQGTLGLEILEDVPDLEAVIVPIGGGGLISGVSRAIKLQRPQVKVIGVESAGAPGMARSLAEHRVVELERVDCIIDGLRVKRVGSLTRAVAQRHVDEIVTLSDAEIFDALLWTMHYTKLVVEGAAAATVGVLLANRAGLPAGATVVCVLSGGNVNLERLRGMTWN